MEKLKEEFTSEGILMHHTVVALIIRNKKYLLVERATFPSGFALITGHVDDGESPQEALVREVKEEIGVDIISLNLIFEGVIGNSSCNKGADIHRTFVFECRVNGEIKLNKEENKIWKWYSKDEMKRERLGEYWRRLLEIMKII